MATPPSPLARAEEAFAELERLVRHLGDELTFFRRRALEAERRLKEVVPHAEPGAVLDELRARADRLEAENADLRARLAEATERTRGMAERVKFLRQQQEAEGG